MKSCIKDLFLRQSYFPILFSYLLVSGPISAFANTDIEQAVVKIIGSNNQVGTGFLFFISSDGGNQAYVITAYHVVKDFDLQNRFQVIFSFSNERYEARVLYPYPNIDLAILVLYYYPKNIKYLKFGNIGTSFAGSKVYIYGYPGGGQLRRDDGTVSLLSGSKIYLDDIEPDYGNSGGPVLDAQTNKVIGMIIQKARDAGSQYAVNIQQIKTIVENNIIFKSLQAPGVKSKPMDPTSIMSTPLRIEPETLSQEDIREMIIKNGFYEGEINPLGVGINNQYQLFTVPRGGLEGLTISNVTKELAQSMGLNISRGAIVSKVRENSYAYYAGFEKRDILIQFDDKEVDYNLHLVKLIYSSKGGKNVGLKLIRNNQLINMDVRITPSEDKVIFDYTTGLMWQQEVSYEKVKYGSHEDAREGIKILNYLNFAGYNDWRLPTLEEALSIMEAEEMRQFDLQYLDPVFTGGPEIWTSDLLRTAGYWWSVNYRYGEVRYSSNLARFRAVRRR